MRTTPIILLMLLSTACATTKTVDKVQTVRDLMAERKGNLGHNVIVRGYLQFTPSRRGLSERQELSDAEVDDDVRFDCITIWGYETTDLERFSRLNGHLVRVEGRFRYIPLKDNEINLWECNDYGIVVTSITESD